MDPFPEPPHSSNWPLQQWPPEPSGPIVRSPVPMFPLPGLFLFPGQLLPLFVFEPRYRQMVEDVLDGVGRIVIATVREAHRADLPGSPPVLEVGGLGEIMRHDRRDDGCYGIWLIGIARVQLEETPSDRPYRMVRCRTLSDVPATVREDSELRPRLVDAISHRAGRSFEVAPQVGIGTLADVLAQCLVVPETVMVDLQSETDVAERARKVLSANDRFAARRPGGDRNSG